MSALEQWLMDLLIEHNVLMLRAEAEVKAKVLALLILLQKDVVGVLANAPALSELGKAGKNALLRESNELIADYYGRAQLVVDLGAVAEVEALGVRSALSTVIEARLGVGMPTENYLRTLVSDTLVQGSPARAWWLRQEQDTAFKLATQIRIGAAQGETNAQIVARVIGTDEIPGVMPMARKNALSIVQTSMATVAAEARRATFEMNSDLMTGIEQVSTLDGHTSLMCIAYSGAQWDLDYEPMGENDLPYNGGVPRHFNCLPGDALVLPRSGITGVSKRWFDGEVIVIRTASGRELTSTPNHPILTSGGWVAARLINVGSNVVCDGGSEWKGIGNGDHQNIPTRIEDEFGSFFAARKVHPVPVPLSTEDFHGDGGGSKIAVIWTESFLRDRVNPALQQHCGQGVFVDGTTAITSPLVSGGAGDQPGLLCGDAPQGSVRCCGERDAIGGRGSSHPGRLLGAAVSCINTVALQDFGDNTDRNPKLVVDALHANAGLENLNHVGVSSAGGDEIANNSALKLGSRLGDAGLAKNSRDDLIVNEVLGSKFSRGGAIGEGCDNIAGGQCRPDLATQGDVGALQNIEDGDIADAELGRNILDGGAGAVFLDDVISVNVRQFSGHVYNLETVGGWYSANGIVTHNCRSTEIAVMKTFREMGIDLDEPEPGTRASSSGPISAKTTFADYLTMKGADYQNEVLGPGRAALFREGKLAPRDLVNMSGRPLKLSALKEMYSQ
ncbi:Hint domain-containing protein [Massilia sp. CCM 8734]|uniref:Hint domain-containing protein n=1 Tax=Massilia sp. CCM 8734 TaxID=2609283 RepID=UPI001421E3DA|nr:Hint domain-containing protein [Massilia sp. CCM 8734]NHZ94563.1 hypothetical protein [Massilia sp. CCM 8734]